MRKKVSAFQSNGAKQLRVGNIFCVANSFLIPDHLKGIEMFDKTSCIISALTYFIEIQKH